MYKKIIIKILILIISCIVIYNFIFTKNDTDNIINYDLEDYSNYNKTAVNTNTEIKKTKIKVYIIGQVKSCGVVELDDGSRIEDAIILAGGPTEIADLSKVNLAYILEDGEQIYIPSLYDNDTQYIIEGNYDNNSKKDKKININKCDVTELTSIPGIGESTAQKIINYRTKNGKFSSIEDLKKIDGIGEKKFEKIKEYIDIK